MPINVADNLPAIEVLENENIFVMKESRAYHQDIRALKILILNLMPLKEVTETQLLRLLGNSPLQVDIVLLHPDSHQSKNTSEEHLSSFYQSFSEIKDQKFDGMIITGAPVEQLEFEEVDYWEELTEIMDWKLENVTSTLHICWGAQAGLYYYYGVAKYPSPEKIFGVFEHRCNKSNVKLLRGFDSSFLAPHSRHTKIKREDIEEVQELQILAESKEAGIYIVASIDGRQIFVTGHAEYDSNTLELEYYRDVKKGLDIKVPKNYFKNNNPKNEIMVGWKAHAHLLFSNWLNYYVYQATPYDINQIK